MVQFYPQMSSEFQGLLLTFFFSALNQQEAGRPFGTASQSRATSDGKASAYNVRDLGSIPGLARSPGEGNGNPLQYSCLDNPIDRGAWWATIHGVTRESDMTYQLNTNNIYGGASLVAQTVKNLPAMQKTQV